MEYVAASRRVDFIVLNINWRKANRALYGAHYDTKNFTLQVVIIINTKKIQVE